MMKKLAASVTAQAETVATLSTKMNGGSIGSGKPQTRIRRGQDCTCASTASAKYATRTGTVRGWR